jgi:hypothetical protein
MFTANVNFNPTMVASSDGVPSIFLTRKSHGLPMIYFAIVSKQNI